MSSKSVTAFLGKTLKNWKMSSQSVTGVFGLGNKLD